MLLGLTGHLLSSSFLETKLSLADRRPFTRLRDGSRSLGPASSLRAVLESGARPLLESAGFQALRDVNTDSESIVATVGEDARAVVLLVASWGNPLHLHWRAAIAHATRRQARWCLLYNGLACRLMDATRPHSSRFAEFDLAMVADDENAAAAFRLVTKALHDSLDALVRESDQHGVAVCRSLQDGVLAASGDVLSALARPGRSRRPHLHAALDQALTIVYRVLFLLFAESRGLVPLWHPIYRESYAIETLVALAARGDNRGLWDALRAIARLAHTGCRAGDLRVTPFNGRLFSPSRTPLAERRDLDDEHARRALLSLATRTSSSGAGRERIVYRDLGVEQLGSVYESLLDYQPSANPIALVPGTGVRKATGTFYTPQPIADYLVRTTLVPLVDGARPHDILSLRIVDPSMGSGAFLVAACHFLAQAYEAALIRNGGCHASDIGESDRASIRRTIAERCLYGVDINPMAVQLARLSLWLTTLAADRPLTFLDHRLRCGDSLLGAWIEHLRHPPRSQRRVSRDDDTGQLFEQAGVEGALQDALPIRFSLERTPDDTLEQVREKEHALAALERGDTGLSRWKRIADVWCAAWMSTRMDDVPATAFHALSDHVLNGRGSLPLHTADRYLERAQEISAARKIFHWELEFPEVFFDAGGQRRPRAGFDAVLGNPPWEMIRADEGTIEARVRNRSRNSIVLRFIRDAGLYPSSSSGHPNLYQLFTDRTISLLRPGGRLGLVLPFGLATDHGSAELRRRLLRECDTDALVGLNNQRAVFAIHRSVKFLLATATKGSPTQSIACRLGETDVAALDGAGERPATSDWFRVRLTPGLIERVSGATLTIPELRTPLDVSIIERAATLFPPLGSDRGWSARFGRELNASDDRARFGSKGLPIVEGKHIEPFRVHVDRCRHRVAASQAARLLKTGAFERPRLAYRDVASATNKTTLIAAILPRGCVSTHTLFCLRTPTSLPVQHFLCGMFNSLVVNYLVRMRVTTHVTTATVERLPVPPPGHSPSAQRLVGAIARLLSRRDDRDAWVQLQVLAASLYQLTPTEFAHVLGTFPLIAKEDRDAAHATYEATEARRTQK
ncbi:MAG TPA: N-6 DNA methylase [Vicinamibacterales bacterium]|nr:N-6 DNA methylase [Vicinamibacterales bacterium]